MDKILLVKTSSLGDIVHTYPVVGYLRKKFPSAQIDWVVEAPFADLVRSHPDVNRVLTVSTKQWRKNIFCRETWQSIAQFRKDLQDEQYDAVFDLQGNIKSGLITSLANSSCKVGFGRESVPEWPNLLFTNHRFNPSSNGNIRHDYLSLVALFFKEQVPLEDSHVVLKISESERAVLNSLCIPQPSVVVCPGSAWRNKQLTPETLTNFLKLLRDDMKCHFLFVWGSNEEKEFAAKLHQEFADHSQVIEKMNLPMLQNLMGRCDLVIAMDSLPLHLAGTTNTPSFSVFGASSAAKYKPIGTQHHALQGQCPYGRKFEKRCPILRTCPTGVCIRDLHAQELFAAFKPWWTNLENSTQRHKDKKAQS